ncbi:UNKNOWN [Stylonychia lemnae]|uniref:Uncharacterized protein n=1 Tax=Stylonychia lemnae TaxID=5949 RepID=A0A078API7_STYLE|nr:UNKNOWN [Stylonychia lemnae]|eukprot:CDW84285.1 UNKNOWN [Stylonychia lemnae]
MHLFQGWLTKNSLVRSYVDQKTKYFHKVKKNQDKLDQRYRLYKQSKKFIDKHKPYQPPKKRLQKFSHQIQLNSELHQENHIISIKIEGLRMGLKQSLLDQQMEISERFISLLSPKMIIKQEYIEEEEEKQQNNQNQPNQGQVDSLKLDFQEASNRELDPPLEHHKYDINKEFGNYNQDRVQFIESDQQMIQIQERKQTIFSQERKTFSQQSTMNSADSFDMRNNPFHQAICQNIASKQQEILESYKLRENPMYDFLDEKKLETIVDENKKDIDQIFQTQMKQNSAQKKLIELANLQIKQKQLEEKNK